MYSFKTQNKIGQAGEVFLDQWLPPAYQIVDVSNDKEYQKSGIDRLVTRPDGSIISIEYKCDLMARKTGNLFFETTSNDRTKTPGWGWTSKADYWMFLIPQQEILVFQPERLRWLVGNIQNTLKEKSVPNHGYNTIGYPVPLTQAKRVVFKSICLHLDNL